MLAALVALGVGVAVAVVARRNARSAESLVTDTVRDAERLRRELVAADADRRQMQLVLSSMDEGVLLFAPDGRLRFANDAAERLLGARPGTARSEEHTSELQSR